MGEGKSQLVGTLDNAAGLIRALADELRRQGKDPDSLFDLARRDPAVQEMVAWAMEPPTESLLPSLFMAVRRRNLEPADLNGLGNRASVLIDMIADLLVAIKAGKPYDPDGDMLSRPVTVDRSRSFEDLVSAIGGIYSLDPEALASMPRGAKAETIVYLFPVRRFFSGPELSRRCILRGITADPYALAQLNADDPSFMEKHPNGAQWMSGGRWYCLTFRSDQGRPMVGMSRVVGGWVGYWWLSGARPKPGSDLPQ